jgi:hypothetical protein
MRPIVVSKPAMSSPIDCEISSGPLRRSPPSSSARMRPLRMSSVSVPRAHLDQLLEVGGERHPGGGRAFDHLGVGDAGREPMRRLRRPHREALAIGHRHAEHLADDGRRHRQRQIGDHVHLAAHRDAIEAVVDDTLDAVTQRIDRARREGAAHQAAEPRVRRRILLQHEQALSAQRLVDAWQHAVGHPHAGRDLVQQAVHVGISREPPRADRRQVHRVDLAQAVEARGRIVVEAGRPRIGSAPRVVGIDLDRVDVHGRDSRRGHRPTQRRGPSEPPHGADFPSQSAVSPVRPLTSNLRKRSVM